jgi:hypothetical protein
MVSLIPLHRFSWRIWNCSRPEDTTVNEHDFTMSLGIRHPSVDPARITHALGLEPGHVWSKGEQRLGPTGAALAGSHRESYWICEIAPRPKFSGERVGVEHELSRLLQKLRKSIGFIQDLNSSGGVTELLVTIFARGDFRMQLPPEDAAMLGSMEIVFSVEVKSGQVPTPAEHRLE